VIAGDGQVTLGQSIVMKPNAKKVRRLADGVISGFAGQLTDRIGSRLCRFGTRLTPTLLPCGRVDSGCDHSF